MTTWIITITVEGDNKEEALEDLNRFDEFKMMDIDSIEKE